MSKRLPPSRGSKLGYYRTSIACVHCRKKKARCVLAEGKQLESCINCRRKGLPCTFLTVDKKLPEWTNHPSRAGPAPSSTTLMDAPATTGQIAQGNMLAGRVDAMQDGPRIRYEQQMEYASLDQYHILPTARSAMDSTSIIDGSHHRSIQAWDNTLDTITPPVDTEYPGSTEHSQGAIESHTFEFDDHESVRWPTIGKKLPIPDSTQTCFEPAANVYEQWTSLIDSRQYFVADTTQQQPAEASDTAWNSWIFTA